MSNQPKNTNLLRKTIRGTIWIYISTYSAKAFVFISTIVLSRLLMPEDFGLAGYALVTLGILEMLEGLGLRQALIYHHKHPGRTNTAFWLALGFGIGLFILILLLAPLIGWLLKEERTIAMLRVLALTVPIASLGLVHNALIHKELEFKNRFVVECIKSLSKGVFSILLAATGFGVWSLIYGYVIGVISSIIGLWLLVPWRPSIQFKTSHVGPLMSYGTKIISSRVFSTLPQSLYYLLIGRFIGAAALGIYIVALRAPELFIKQFSSGISIAIFPTYSKLRGDAQTLKRGFLLATRYVNMITIPLGLGLALVAEPFVRVFFTDKWLAAVPLLSILSLSIVFRILMSNIGPLCSAQGRPGLVLKINIGQMLVAIPALIWATVIVGSLTVVAWTQCALALLLLGVRLYVAVQVLNISLRSIAETLHLTIVGGAFMAIAVTGVLNISATMPPIIQLLASVFVGGLVYTSTLWILQYQAMIEAGHALRTAVSRK